MNPLYEIFMTKGGNLIASRRLCEDFEAMRRPAQCLYRGGYVVREATSSLDALRQVEKELGRTKKERKVKA